MWSNNQRSNVNVNVIFIAMTGLDGPFRHLYMSKIDDKSYYYNYVYVVIVAVTRHFCRNKSFTYVSLNLNCEDVMKTGFEGIVVHLMYGWILHFALLFINLPNK